MQTHFHDTREAIQPQKVWRRDRQQDWSIGQTVRVGFLDGFTVTGFDGRDYSLSRNGKSYIGRPHRGVKLVEAA